MITLLFLCHHSQIDEVIVNYSKGWRAVLFIITTSSTTLYYHTEMFVVSAKKKRKKVQRLVFHLLVGLGAPESHLVLLHPEPPWLQQDLNVQVGLPGHASPVHPGDPAPPCLQPTDQVNNISRPEFITRPVHPSQSAQWEISFAWPQTSWKAVKA